MIGIIDYGLGNLSSVQNALDHLQIDHVTSDDIAILSQANRLILPGVGAFEDGMRQIREKGLYEWILKEVKEKKIPLLGICLGMQLMYESSEENGYHEGFGFFKGTIRKMKDTDVPIPHMGWNLLEKTNEDPVWQVLDKEPFVYYVHSYCAQDYDSQDVLGMSTYGKNDICGLVHKENFWGMQFHPEKSSQKGLALLSYFAKGGWL